MPTHELSYLDDSDRIADAEIIKIDWPAWLNKPRFGIVRDYGAFPRWTKYCRFLENNGFEYELYNYYRKTFFDQTNSRYYAG